MVKLVFAPYIEIYKSLEKNILEFIAQVLRKTIGNHFKENVDLY